MIPGFLLVELVDVDSCSTLGVHDVPVAAFCIVAFSVLQGYLARVPKLANSRWHCEADSDYSDPHAV